jgi:hypothetical protein
VRRSLSLLLITLFSVGLIAAGCGGDDDKTGASGTTSGSPSSTDAKAILSGIKPATGTGPQKIGLNLAVGLKGTLKDPTVGALLGSGPITADISGPTDAEGKKADLKFAVKAGKINLAGSLRLVGDKAYVQLGDKWYEAPLDSATQGGTDPTEALDPAKVLEALGDPTVLVNDAKVVGAEDVDGIATDHVSGTINTEEVVKAIGRLSGTLDKNASPIDPKQISDATAQLEKFVKSANVDIWVGQDDKQIHRFTLDVDAVLDAETKASSGLDGFTAAITVSATPTDAPSVEAPSGALPASQLQTDLGPIILSGLGGATP